jgi:uncharacterized protein
MAGSSQGYHEAESALSAEIKDRHRAIASLMEELEAVDWYDQRVAAATDSALADLLAHNRDEEKEHASMVLEWIRRRDACWDEHLHRYLFTDAPLLDIEAHAEAAAADAESALGDGSLGIGSLKGTTNL